MNTSQDPQPRKSWPRRHKILTTLAALIMLGVIISVASGGGGNDGARPGASVASSPAASPASAPGIGSKVRDGKFQFTITRVSHRRGVGTLGLGQTAQGRFTVLHVTVTNIGGESQTLSDSDQYVYDASGRKFDADSQADIYANPSGDSVFLQDINPGNTVRGVILFDLPAGDKAVRAELHDSAFSGGVTVSLAS